VNGAIRKAIRSQPTGNSAQNEPALYSVLYGYAVRRHREEQMHGGGGSA